MLQEKFARKKVRRLKDGFERNWASVGYVQIGGAMRWMYVSVKSFLSSGYTRVVVTFGKSAGGDYPRCRAVGIGQLGG